MSAVWRAESERKSAASNSTGRCGRATALFDLLQSYVTKPENTVRWSWRKNDVAIWDSQATQHYALNEHDGQNRTMRRTTVDGRRSRMIRRPEGANIRYFTEPAVKPFTI